MKIKLVYVSGKIDYGKTNITTLIHDELITYSNERDYHVTRFSFGDKVKEIARKYFFWDGKKDDRGRKALTDIGHVAGRGYDPDVWVKHFNMFLKSYADMFTSKIEFFNDVVDDKKHLLVFIDDWRYPNEFKNPQVYKEKIPREHKFGIRIHRTIEETKQHNNPSETSLSDNPDDYDFFLENEFQSFDELKQSSEFKSLIENVKSFIDE